MSVFLSIGTADVTANRTFKLAISGNAGVSTPRTPTRSSRIPQADQSATDVAKAFRDLIHLNIVANGTVDTANYGNLVSASAAQLAFFTPAGVDQRPSRCRWYR